jgi:hypothetical protein
MAQTRSRNMIPWRAAWAEEWTTRPMQFTPMVVMGMGREAGQRMPGRFMRLRDSTVNALMGCAKDGIFEGLDCE